MISLNSFVPSFICVLICWDCFHVFSISYNFTENCFMCRKVCLWLCVYDASILLFANAITNYRKYLQLHDLDIWHSNRSHVISSICIWNRKQPQQQLWPLLIETKINKNSSLPYASICMWIEKVYSFVGFFSISRIYSVRISMWMFCKCVISYCAKLIHWLWLLFQINWFLDFMCFVSSLFEIFDPITSFSNHHELHFARIFYFLSCFVKLLCRCW